MRFVWLVWDSKADRKVLCVCICVYGIISIKCTDPDVQLGKFWKTCIHLYKLYWKQWNIFIAPESAFIQLSS